MRHDQIPEELLTAVYTYLLRFWMRKGNSEDIARDITHAGLVKVFTIWDERKKYGIKDLEKYLVQVGIKAGLDYLRKESRQEKIKQKLSGDIEK